MSMVKPADRQLVRKYAPLSSLAAGLLVAVVVLPSSLNLPQTNPQTVLEYAPVPPNQSAPPPPGSNFSALGLGSSGTLGAGTPGGGAGGASGMPLANPLSGNPSNYRCVGSPPRQTEDPLSPPCVAFFSGNNGGSTYEGVSATELRVLIYIDEESVNNQQDPSNTYCDLAKPLPAACNDDHTQALLALMRYFNSRYQTYNRFVHFIIYYTGSSTSTTNYSPEYRRADAEKNLTDVHPAVAITYAWEGNEQAYLDAMASRGVLVFGSFAGLDQAFFNQYAGLIWGYYPSIDQQAKQFSSYLCTKVVNHRVSFSGNQLAALSNGNPRKLGILYADNPAYPGYKEFAEDVVHGLSACGASALPRSFCSVGYTYDTTSSCASTAGSTAAQNMAYFLQQNVTTIIWAQGYETLHMTAASNIKYYPEWILAGDGTIDGYGGMRYEDTQQMADAWVVSNAVRQGEDNSGYCWQAVEEGNPNLGQSSAGIACGEYPFYENLRQVFTGIQVAGPHFDPSHVDQGFHAIPAVPSTDPQTPACFYESNDFTCVKDDEAMWWSNTLIWNGQPGCWAMAEGGKRYLPGQWPPGDVRNIQNKQTDSCNGFSGNYYL